MLDAPAPTPRLPRPERVAVPRPGPRVVAVVLAVLAAVATQLTYEIFVRSASGQRLDNLALDGSHHGRGTLWSVAEQVLDVVSVAFVVVAVGASMVLALARRRWLLALQVAVLIGGANVTTQVLKDLVYTRPRHFPGWLGDNSLPSGHTTVAAAVAMALLLACPRAWRPAVAVLGAMWTAATGISTLVGGWHRPSDVVAAVLVSFAWAAGVSATSSRTTLDEVPQPGVTMRAPGSWLTAGLMGLAAAVAGFVALVALTDLGTDVVNPPFKGDVTAYAGGIAGVAAVTAGAFAVLLVLRQATARPQHA